MIAFLLSAALALVLFVYYPETCVPTPPAPPGIPRLIEPSGPNAFCGTADEEWEEYELGCNNRQQRLI